MMRPLSWAVLAIILIIVIGLFSRIAGMLLWPIAAVLLIFGFAIWLLLRKSQGEPPVG